MNLFTMLDEKTVLPNLKAENKEQVINDLIDTLRYDVDSDTIEEIRQNSISNYSSQLRNVTSDDYLVRALSMPSKYGVVAKAHVQKPNIDDYLSSLDLYVLSYDSDKNLQQTSSTLKHNLKTYLSQYRMIGDTISIKDAFVINFGIEFDIVSFKNSNKRE